MSNGKQWFVQELPESGDVPKSPFLNSQHKMYPGLPPKAAV